MHPDRNHRPSDDSIIRPTILRCPVQFLSVAPRQEEATGDSSLARYAMRAGNHFGRHSHDDAHQLSWSPTGLLQVTTDSQAFCLAPTQALWVSAGVAHDVTCVRDAVLHNLYVRPDAQVVDGPAALVTVGGLLAQLLLRVAEDDISMAERMNLERVIFDVIRPTESQREEVILPRDERAHTVATALLRHPADDRSIDDWGRCVGASGRTLARRFVAETGMTFTDWRTRLRISRAMAMLADDVPVEAVARRVGYRSTSAFSATFRKVTGQRPSRFGG